MYKDDGKRFWQQILAPCGQHCDISAKDNPQILCKMPDFQHTLSIINEMLGNKERQPLPLGYFITFVRCIRMTGGGLDSIYMSLMVNIMSFLPPSTLKLHVNYQILGTPSQHRKLDAVLYEETLIATWVFQNLPWMHKDGGRSVCQHMQTIYGFRSVISAKKDHSMFMQNIRFWALYQLSKLDDVLQEETPIATWAFHNHH